MRPVYDVPVCSVHLPTYTYLPYLGTTLGTFYLLPLLMGVALDTCMGGYAWAIVGIVQVPT
jgi:hypothetical protein